MTPDDNDFEVNPGPTTTGGGQVVDMPTNQPSLWRKVVAVITILLGVLAGFWGGFAISFSACFKSSCSPTEETAWITVPIATLFLTIPFAKWLNRNEKGALKKIIFSSIMVGLVGFAIMWTSMF